MTVWQFSKKQKDIADLINDSFCNREQSKRLLDIAKQGVELAIEKDEKEAQRWMNEQTGNLGIKL